MKFLYTFAGIPRDVHDRVYAAHKDIVQGDGQFLAFPIPGFTRAYDPSYIENITIALSEKLASDHQNTLEDTGFAVIYIDFENDSCAALSSALFPAVLMVPVKWQYEFGPPNVQNASVNMLIAELKIAARKAKLALTALKNEVSKNMNRTPVLLPVKNFRSVAFRPLLEGLSQELSVTPKPQDAVARFTKAVQAKHQPKPIVDSKAKRKRKGMLYAYSDDGQVQFAPPGKDQHGFSRPSAGHTALCLLSGRRRLGTPYAHAFHYDCTRMGEKLVGDFHGCHEDATRWKGDPHLNIAPNDAVRN